MKKWVLMLALVLSGSAVANAGEVLVHRSGYTLQAEQYGNGPNVVVFESGFGQNSGVWKDVIANLGNECTCITYSRAGLGKSGSDGKPKTIEEHLQDLNAVIDTVAQNRKVVLVGHSYGGLLATEFARTHPDRLQGLVLVDPATMGQRRAFKQIASDRVMADDKALLSMLPPNLAADYKLLVAQMDSNAATSSVDFPDVPVALLTSTQVPTEPLVFEETTQGKALWRRQHAELFSGFLRGTHQYYATGHNIHRQNPKAVADDVRLVVAASQPGS